MSICKLGLRQIGSLIVAAIIGIFLTFSMNVIFSAIFTEEIGYTAYVYENKESTESMAQYDYFYTDNDGDGKDDGTDTKRKEYEAKGNIVVVQMQRSSLEGSGKTVFLIVTQIFSMVMVLAFAGDRVYKQGLKDAPLIRTGNMKKDTLKGLKVGLIGNIPFVLLAILMVVLALGVAPEFKNFWYAIFFNGHLYSIMVAIINGKENVCDLSVMQFVAIFAVQLIVPAISCVAYILGLKEINLGEKIVLKKR